MCSRMVSVSAPKWLGTPNTSLDRLPGVGKGGGLRGVPQDLGFFPDVVDDPAARDRVDERSDGGFPAELPVPDLFDDLGDDLVGHVLPVRGRPSEGLPDPEGYDGPELQDKLVQVDGGLVLGHGRIIEGAP